MSPSVAFVPAQTGPPAYRRAAERLGDVGGPAVATMTTRT